MDELLLFIMSWLVFNFQVEPAPTIPEVSFLLENAMPVMRATLATSGTSVELGGPAVHAFYHVETRTIFLTEGWRADSPSDTSILVHEVVHHLQTVNGKTFECNAAREGRAYEAQELWLAQFGTSLEAEFGIDDMTRLVISACGR